MTITLYGISNCDTVRKARKWCEAEGIKAAYHDFRKDGLSKDHVEKWMAAIGADKLVNKRGTTWRGLSDAEKASTGAALVDLLVANPAIIKRPVIEHGGTITVGFTKTEQDALKATAK